MTTISESRPIGQPAAVLPASHLPDASRFTASDPWNAARPEALVICCSDGRWHAQVEEFVRAQVSVRADLYAIPGGPAGLNPRSSSVYERRVAETAFHFLVEHHELESVWLIAHQDCAYYRVRHSGLDPSAIVRRQLDDLQRVAETIQGWRSQLLVHKVYASLDAGRVVFQGTLSGSQLRA